MKRVLRRANILLIGMLAVTLAAQAQQPASVAPTFAELTKNLAAISEGSEETIGDLADQTARQLVVYLKAHELSDAEAGELGLEEVDCPPDAARLRVYTFGYASGGTRGTVHCPILQWKNAAGQLFAYRLHEECGPTELHQLASPGRSLYLLLGQEQGDMNTTASMAYVLEVKGNYLRLDNAAFGPSSSLTISNVEMSFDDRQQVLRLDLSDHDGCEEDDKLLAQLGYRGTFPKRPMTMFRRTYPPPQPKGPGRKILDLKFSNGHFAKSQ